MNTETKNEIDCRDASNPDELLAHLADVFLGDAADCDVCMSKYNTITITREEYESVMLLPAEDNRPLVVRILDEANKKYLPTSADLIQYGKQLTEIIGSAQVRYIYDDDPPGVDMDGSSFNVNGKLMFTTASYPEGIKFLTNEVGCVVDEDMLGGAIRLVRVEESRIT